MADEMTSPGAGNPLNKKPLKVAMVVAGLIVVGTLAWIIFKKPTEPPILTPESPSPELPVAPAETQITWQTYSNQKYGYSLKYPSGWFLEDQNAEKDMTGSLGGEIVIANKENPISFINSGTALPEDLITLVLAVYQIDANTSVDQFIKNQKYTTPLSQTAVKYGGLDGKQLIYTAFGSEGKETLKIVTLLKQNSKLFVFSYGSFKPEKLSLPLEVEIVHDAILRSFMLK